MKTKRYSVTSNSVRRPHESITVDWIFILFSCPTANFGPVLSGYPHHPNINHCVYSNLDPKVTSKTLADNPNSKTVPYHHDHHSSIHFIRHSIYINIINHLLGLYLFKIFKPIYYVLNRKKIRMLEAEFKVTLLLSINATHACYVKLSM